MFIIHPAVGEEEIINQTITPAVTLEYHIESSLQNDPLELYVTQGDKIYRGKTYDLSGVSGLSYQFAHWNDWKIENTDCSPDQINDIWYIRTGTNMRAVYLDPEKWSSGNWYYWDWWECNLTHYDYSKRKTVQATGPLQADNKLAFILINPLTNAFNIKRETDASINPIQSYQSVYE